jgi:predicted amidohydrolase
VMDFGFATAGITICYDYIFPEYLRDLAVRGARLIVHPTAWVDTQSCRDWHYPAAEAYRAQCQVRALENGVFFMSANHCGPYDEDGNLQGVGRSAIIAPWGEVLAEVGEGPGVAVAEAEFSKIEEWACTAAPYLSDFLKVPRPH